MVTVAISGATSTIGSNLVDEILSSKKHHLVVVSRSEQLALTNRGAEVCIVDYEKADELSEALRGVHTVISCIWAFGPEMASSQLSLLGAAKTAGVKRFVPSDWAVDQYQAITAYNPKAVVWDAVQASGLEYTRFINGIWMNAWGVDAPRDQAEALSYYTGPYFLVDVKAGKATVLGDGTQKVVFTHTRDIARYVAASLDMERWEPDSRIAGDSLSYLEVVGLAEKATGRKLEISHVPVEQLESVLASGPDGITQFFHEFMLAITKGKLNFEDAKFRSGFPEIKPMTGEEFFSKHWGNV